MLYECSQFSSVAQSCLTLCDPMDCSMPDFPVYHQLLELIQTHVHLVSDVIQLSHPLSSHSPLAPNPSQHQSLFQWVNTSHEVPKSWSFSFSIISAKEIPGMISFRMDWLDLLAVQGTLKSSPTPQFKSINSSALSFLYSPTLMSIHEYCKNHSLTRWTFVGKVMSLLLNMQSRLLITRPPDLPLEKSICMSGSNS